MRMRPSHPCWHHGILSHHTSWYLQTFSSMHWLGKLLHTGYLVEQVLMEAGQMHNGSTAETHLRQELSSTRKKSNLQVSKGILLVISNRKRIIANAISVAVKDVSAWLRGGVEFDSPFTNMGQLIPLASQKYGRNGRLFCALPYPCLWGLSRVTTAWFYYTLGKTLYLYIMTEAFILSSYLVLYYWAISSQGLTQTHSPLPQEYFAASVSYPGILRFVASDASKMCCYSKWSISGLSVSKVRCERIMVFKHSLATGTAEMIYCSCLPDLGGKRHAWHLKMECNSN